MSTLIFDIETIGDDFDSFDSATQESLTRFINREPTEEHNRILSEVKDGLGFSPLTGRIVAIGVFDNEREKGAVYFDTRGVIDNGGEIGKQKIQNESEEVIGGKTIKLKPMNEKEMLGHFWHTVSNYDTFGTFNGRGFDVPFLMIRSAVHGIRPSKNLMSNRYLQNQDDDACHIDLLDQLSFYGAVRRKGNLHLWCRAFGIESPKASGITGDDVKRLYNEERYLDIARYNAGDIIATNKLYQHWRKYLTNSKF